MKKRFLKNLVNTTFILVLTLLVSSCEQETVNNVEQTYRDNKSIEIFNNVHYQIVVIDSCEYIIGKDDYGYNGGFFLSHKGNCKYCENRNK